MMAPLGPNIFTEMIQTLRNIRFKPIPESRLPFSSKEPNQRLVHAEVNTVAGLYSAPRMGHNTASRIVPVVKLQRLVWQTESVTQGELDKGD
jgi:hypothetical protein